MPTVTAPAGIRSTILVVEDETGIARMVQVLLEARGFSTIVTHSGSEALQRLADHPVDLVLLDVMMPGMDGYEVCRRLKADERWRHLPVVMLTAKDTSRDMVLGLEIGADDYITKPFNTDELIARIKVLLRVRGMSQEVMRRNRETPSLECGGAGREPLPRPGRDPGRRACRRDGEPGAGLRSHPSLGAGGQSPGTSGMARPLRNPIGESANPVVEQRLGVEGP